MNSITEYNPIKGVTLHLKNGNLKYYAGEDLIKLINDLSVNLTIEFAIVTLTNKSSPLIFHDVQEIMSYFDLKF